jgi:hypothetical protein
MEPTLTDAGVSRRPVKRLGWLAFWGGYSLLPLLSHGFYLSRLNCVPFYDAAIFLTFFAWLGYFGVAVIVGVPQMVEKKEARARYMFGSMLVFALLYGVGFLPALLEHCMVFVS